MPPSVKGFKLAIPDLIAPLPNVRAFPKVPPEPAVIAFPTPPRPGIDPTNPPIPLATLPKPTLPKRDPPTAPKAWPTPGINIATGATFLATFFTDLKVFFNQPNSGCPVIGLILICGPTIYSSGSNPAAIISLLNLACVSALITGGTTLSPGATCATKRSSSLPKLAIPVPELSIIIFKFYSLVHHMLTKKPINSDYHLLLVNLGACA